MWDFGDGSKDSNKVNVEHQFVKPGIKYVTLTGIDIQGCKGDTTIKFNWQPAPAIIIAKPDIFGGCSPATVLFTNRSTPVDSTYKVAWDFGDGSFSNEISPRHIYLKDGTYNVKLEITSPIGCYKKAIFRNLINVKPSPVASFLLPENKISNLKPDVEFTDQSIDAHSWRWTFGDGKFSNEQNPSHKFRDTGVFNIKLTVKNVFSCTDTFSKKLYVYPEVTFFMPNAFTPNYDTVNDEFKGVGYTFGMKNFSMTVWNRWGEMIFETNNPNTGWNGLKNNTGEEIPNGIYLYDVSFTGFSDTKQNQKGYVTLIR